MKSFFIISLLALLGVCMNACLEDESNLDYQMITPIIIDTTGIPSSFQVYQHADLRIAPEVSRAGATELFYKWEIKENGVDRILSREMILDVPIPEAPQSKAYKVLLTVTDSTTGISALLKWDVTVSSMLGEGLVVADTRDGIQSDLSLIMAYNFTDAYRNKSRDTVFHDLYSRSNQGAKIDGIVIDLMNTNYQTNRSLTVLTAGGLYRMDPYSYVCDERDNDLFVVPFKDKSEIKPAAIRFIPGIAWELLLIEGKIYPRTCQQNNRSYSYYWYPDDLQEIRISQFCPLVGRTGAGFAYDDAQHCFLMMPTNGSILKRFKENNGVPFDPRNIGDKECLYMGAGRNNRVYSVMKERSNGSFYLYSMNTTFTDNGVDVPDRLYDLNSCPEIANAEFYATTTLSDVFFYATETEIYAMLLEAEPLTALCRYKVNPGEKITSMQMWKSSGRMLLPSGGQEDQVVTAKERMIVISAYNESTREGKVITIPVDVVGSGGLITDRKYHTEYKGFGKVLAMNPQAK